MGLIINRRRVMITKISIDISTALVIASAQTYSGSAKTPTVTVTLDGIVIPSSDYDVVYSNNINAGTAIITVTGKNDYTGTAIGTFTIAKANPIYVAPTANNRTYNTSSAALLVAGSNTTSGTFTYCTTQSGTYSTTIPSKTNAGTYTTYWKFTPTDTNNYNSVEATAISTTISPKTVSNPTITLSQSTYTYSGSACLPTPTVKDGTTTISSSEYTVSYSNNTNTGTATVTITDNSGGNYTVSGSTTFTINKANPTYTAPVANTLTYTGSSQYLITSGSTRHGTIQYSTNGTSWGTARPSGTNATSYTVYWRLVGDSNHNDVASTQISNVSIAKKAATITAKAQSIVYGNSIATDTTLVTTSGFASIHSLTAITLTPSTSNVTTTGTITPSAATIKQSTTDVTANYDITYNTGTLTITAATPVYTAPTAKSLTYSGSSLTLINAESSSDGTFTYKLSTASSYGSNLPSGTNAGDYTVNWKFTADANHGGGTETGNVTVTIAQKSLTITAKAQTINYGSSIATGTTLVTVSGLVSGDSLTAITLTASTNQVPGGTIKPSNATTTKGIANYDVTYATGNLTINKVAPTNVTAPTAKTLTYNTSAQSLVNAGSATGGTVYYQVTTTNTKPSSTSGFSSTIPTLTNASTYYVWWYVKGDSNHNDTAINTTAISVTISPKTVSSPTITLSTSTYTYSGSACQPIPTVKDGTTTISSSEYTVSYSDNTNAGTATCTISDVTGGNYTVSGSKTFTINPKALTITAKAQTINYGSSIATGTGQVTTSGLVSGDSLTAITLTASTNQVPGGTIKPSAASTTKGASNYNITYNTGNLTINKATPTYTAPTAKTGLVYQDQAQYLVNFGTSFDGTVKYEVTLTNTKPSSTSGFNLVPTGTNAVTYYVWWYVQGDSNHNDTAISSTAITVSIAKANPTYTAPAPISNLVYNGNDQDLFTPGSTSHGTIQFSPDGSTRWVDTVPYAETAGSYTAYWRLVGDNNHNDVAATAIIAIIAKATPSYTAPTALVPTYTGSAQALVSAGSSTEGTFTYSTSLSGTYSSNIPKGTNAGSYTVWWKFAGDTNHSDISATQVTGVSIAQATGQVTTIPTAISRSYTGSNQTIITAGEGTGTMYYRYKLSTSSTWSSWDIAVPSVSAAGTYNIEYYAAASTNHTQSATGTLNSTMSKISRTLSFAQSYAVVAPSGSVTLTATPSAGAGDGTITYSISSTTYATINSSTGAVTAKTSDGSAIVTATISEGTNYQSATVSYNLYVFADTHNYSYTGSVQSVTLPPGSYKLQCWGAQGGANAANSTYGITALAGGKGGYSEGVLTIDTQKTLYAFIGGQGGSSGNGGWNCGGGSTGSSQGTVSGLFGITKMGCGGGATDFALTTSSMTYSSSRNARTSASLLSRIIVAGGGSGGAMAYESSTGVTGTIEGSSLTVSNGYIQLDGTWHVGSSSNQYSLISVTSYRGNNFTINVTTGCFYSFLTATPPTTTGASVSYATGYSGRVNAYTTPSGTVPSNAVYLYIQSTQSGSDRRPSTIVFNAIISDTLAQVGYYGGGETSGGYGQYKGAQTKNTYTEFGVGANCTYTGVLFAPPGAGAGWYGGGTGGSNEDINHITHFGAGSGFVNTAANAQYRPSGYTGIELDSGFTTAGNASMPSTSGSTETGHSGNGYARITRLASTNVREYEYTGAVQTDTLPAGTYKIECWGAQGGTISSTYYGGKGGYSVGELTLNASTNIYVYVGGQGTGGTSTGAKAGGFNGGGLGYSTSSTYVEEGGGGASDVRIGTDSLYARVIVAGGGGGAGSYNSSTSRYSGGVGGGTSGGTGSQYSTSYKAGTGGSLTARGTSYYGSTSNSTTYGTLADFGVGGGAISNNTSYQITGGGGGWYGGGYSRRGPGGGGSGYVYNSSTASNYPSGCLLNSNYYLANSSTSDGSSSNPSTSGDTETGHEGNGYVRITKL